MSYEIPSDAIPLDRRFRYPQAIRVELVRLFRAGWNSRQAANALGLPLSYTATRMNIFRNRHSETAPNPEVIELIKALSIKEASHV